jgi:UMF1 family MFS transporter
MINRKVIAWALYDWANSAFALSVLAVLFPLSLNSYWSAGASGSAVTARLSLVTAAASIVVSILAPVLGTVADAGGYRKRFLLSLGLFGAVMTAALALVGEGDWPIALFFYLLASIGFYGANVFYDSLLMDVSKPAHVHFVSSLGFALGYLGSACLLLLHVWMLSSPATFGLADTGEVVRAAFFTVCAWWIVFMLPLAFLVKEKQERTTKVDNVVRVAYAQLKATVLHIGQYRNVVKFLVAYWLYFGGVFTVISMAFNFGQRMGFDQADLVKAIMLANFIGFPATMFFGYLGQKLGPRNIIYFALLTYTGLSIWAGFMSDVQQFYVMAFVVGCVQGTVQGLSRSFYSLLIPPDQPGEFFGFYNMTTKFSHVIGPTFVATGTLISDAPQFVLLAVLPLFIGGGVLLALVRVPQREAVSATT